jgi:predicted ABC-class ATPase
MATQRELEQALQTLNGRGYKAYRDLERQYTFPTFTLRFERIQGDPFATPSQCRILFPNAITQFPTELTQTPSRAIALRDYLTRQLACAAAPFSMNAGTGGGGRLSIVTPSQIILERTAVILHPDSIEARVSIDLPAYGRRIAGRNAIELLCDRLPQWVSTSLHYANLNATALLNHVQTAEDADALRSQLTDRELVAFIADGAILPRASGVSDRPLTKAIPFSSPPSLRVELETPNQGPLTGMGIPAGVTLLVGGGYHGKSTLLQVIQRGIYNHIPGDGREACVTLPSAVKIRAEEGRQATAVDISGFIADLPQGQSTQTFSTENASGSTSQAVNIMEALAAQTQLLLIDEDTAATNFMIRDRRMQALIAPEKEPITPLVDRITELYQNHGVSSIIVMGGSGDYFEAANTVIAMDTFVPQDVTAAAKAIAQQFPCDRHPAPATPLKIAQSRRFTSSTLIPASGDRRLKVKVQGMDAISLGSQSIDCRGIEQWVETSQLRAIAAVILFLQDQGGLKGLGLEEAIAQVVDLIERQGWQRVTELGDGSLGAVRGIDLAMALNRLRSLPIGK